MFITCTIIIAHGFSNYPEDNSVAIFFFTGHLLGPLFCLYGSRNETPKGAGKSFLFLIFTVSLAVVGLILLASLLFYAPWYSLLILGTALGSAFVVLGLDWIGRPMIRFGRFTD